MGGAQPLAVTMNEGVALVVEVAEHRELAHHRDGHYGVLEFSLPPDQAREFERTIRLTEDILRHIVVRRDE